MKTHKKQYSGNIIQSDICTIMKHDWLQYTIATMVRAIPLSTDGLIPIHRRLLYTLIDYDGRLTKSARIVGDCLGKYSPHGDSATYQAMQKMSQDFRRNAPLTETGGNWGSIDGDDAGGMRYTEVKIGSFAKDVYFGPEYKYCDYKDNYDGTLKEPISFAPKMPVILVNGVFGIVTGYQTNIPTHNISEVCDATIGYLLGKDPLTFLKGPDFPTGSKVLNINNAVERGMAEGKSSIVIMPRTHIEEYGRGRYAIVIEDIPYITDKTKFISNIVEHQQTDEYLKNLADIEDQSDKDVRVLLIFKKVVNANEAEDIRKRLIDDRVISYTYNYSMFMVPYMFREDKVSTPTRYGVNDIIHDWYEYREEVLNRYFTDMILQCKKRIKIMGEVLIFIENYKKLAPVIIEDTLQEIYRKFKGYKIDMETVDYILGSTYNRFRNKADDVRKDVLKTTTELNVFLENKKDIKKYVIGEIKDIRKKHGRDRRTQIIKRGN